MGEKKRQRRAALNEVIEGKVYQRGCFQSWTRKKKDQILSENNIGLVVNLWTKIDPEVCNDVYRTYLHFPMKGNIPPTPDMLDAIIHLIRVHLYEGVAVLIHGEAGVNRSQFLAACMVAEINVVSGEEALAHLANGTWSVKVNKNLRQFIIDRYQ